MASVPQFLQTRLRFKVSALDLAFKKAMVQAPTAVPTAASIHIIPATQEAEPSHLPKVHD